MAEGMDSMQKRGMLGVCLMAMLLFAGLGAKKDSKVPIVGGAAMYPSKNVVENLMNSKDHTTLISALKQAGLVDTLEAPGPYTVFAPSNAGFDKLPAGQLDDLLKPENTDRLKGLLTYHVVPGAITAKNLKKLIGKGQGKAELKTVEGGILTVAIQSGNFVILDGKGTTANAVTTSIPQVNGVLYGIDAVLLPK